MGPVISRRRFIAAGAAGLATAAYGPVLRLPGSVVAAAATATQEIIVSSPVAGIGMYLELPFTVPAGVNRIDLRRQSQPSNSALGLGLFDQRGTGYQSPGFRGIFGEEAKDDPTRNRGGCFVSAHAASEAFVPGTIEPGVWTVLIPVFRCPVPGTVSVKVTLTYGPQLAQYVPGPVPGVIRPEPGWYRGDLHCHTPASSDAWSSGSAMTPSAWAEASRGLGLDYVAMTDHNVVSQNNGLLADSGGDVLLMAGEEMTNWFHGHATVTGINPGDWLDWRQSPGGTLPSGKDGAKVKDFLKVTRELGAYVSAAHPLGAHLAWDFFPEAELDETSRTDGIEVWTGPFQPDDEASLALFDQLLAQGQKVVANGGSDLHGVSNTGGFAAGTPTTIVWAESLSRDHILDGLRAGRSFITRLADGVEIYLEARGPDGQRQMMGGTVYGDETTSVRINGLVRKAGGMRFHWVVGGVRQAPLDVVSDEQTFILDLPVGTGTFVRAEVRDEAVPDTVSPLAGRLDMEAFTNPVFLTVGDPPGDPSPVIPELPGPAAVVALAAAVGAAVVATRHRRGIPTPGGGPMTLTELQLRASAALGLDAPVRLVGQVAAPCDGRSFRLVRWVPGCCPGEDAEVAVEARWCGSPAVAEGDWVEVVAGWIAGSTFESGGVAVDVTSLAVLPVAPERREA